MTDQRTLNGWHVLAFLGAVVAGLFVPTGRWTGAAVTALATAAVVVAQWRDGSPD